MEVRTEPAFEKKLAKRPPHIQLIARHGVEHPNLPQYKLKKLRPAKNLRENSWRICLKSQDYRAICQRLEGDVWAWYWIGTHSEYNHKTGS